ncbi:hypothetical protein ABT369_15175 [Dactylosporangium sp. NPDC000244]|uniref:hypothetical protein n=1 Tax=Dactylosporangium sp. NPDC000244 TaxID=3154365 RepID=UPI0033223763|nr:hypothetical protein GCM10020063_082470 [Dactylosporangium thailandense]
MTDVRFEQLEALSTEELRDRAFALARQKRDIKFFWDLFTHVTYSDEDTQDGWIGSLDATIDDAVALWREVTKHEYGENEPLVRAAFIDYIMKADK